jgi:thiamine-monophosphate kinase
VGGNITGSPDVFFIDITLIGEVEKGKLVRRSTARIGDTIFVTGYPGESAAGLNLLINSSGREVVKESRLINAYKAPSHRAFEAKALADSGYVNAMIDTSDGFLGDLGHICVESNVGAEIVRDQLPLSGALRLESEKSGLEPSALVLGESDDYELIITCAPRHKEEIITVFDGFEDILLSEVGRIVAPPQGIRIMNPDGAFESLDPVGWDHFKV